MPNFNKSFWINDSMGRKIVKYNIPDIKSNNIPPPVNKVTHPRSADTSKGSQISDSCFFFLGYYPENRLIFMNNSGEIIKSFGKVPGNSIKGGGLVHNGINILRVSANQERGKIICANLYSDIIEFYSLEGTLDNIIQGPDGNNIKYKIKGKGVIVDDDNKTLCYINVFTENNFIYLLYSGQNDNEAVKSGKIANLIHVFDYNGNPLKRQILDRYIYRMAVDESKGIIYGIEYGNNNELFLCKFEIKYKITNNIYQLQSPLKLVVVTGLFSAQGHLAHEVGYGGRVMEKQNDKFRGSVLFKFLYHEEIPLLQHIFIDCNIFLQQQQNTNTQIE